MTMNMDWIPGNHRLALPVLGAPMFIISGPELVIAQCKAGVIGAFPALNARTIPAFDETLTRIKSALASHNEAYPENPAAPYAVNLIVHASNRLLNEQLEVCIRHQVPIIITSLGAQARVNEAIRAYGGIVLHDVTTIRHARKALEVGASGLIAVAAGAGGHAGAMSPFGLIGEIRAFWDGPLLLSGAISSGASVLAAQAMGADMAYCGSCFIPAEECGASDGYKEMVLESAAGDVIYTDRVSGTPANFLRASLELAGIDTKGDRPDANYGSDMSAAKAWKDIWSAGHGIGASNKYESVQDIVSRMTIEYDAALARVNALSAQRRVR